MNQINLDINKAGQFINEPVTMRAGETDNVIKASIYKDNKPYTDFKTATFNTTKVSGTVIANDPATVSGNVISYSVAPTVTNTVGKLRNSYFLLDGKTSTESFEVAILPGVSAGSDISAYIPGLQEFQDEWKKVNSGMTGKLDEIDKSVDTFLAKVQAEIDDKNSKFTDDQKAQITSALNDLRNQIETNKNDVNAMDNKLAAIKDSVKDFDVPQITADTKAALDKVKDKVSVIDANNWQKTKITSDIGDEEQKWFSNGDTGATDLKAKLYGLPKGFHTFYSQTGMINNPVAGEPFRGFFHMAVSDSNGVVGYGYMEGTTSDSVYSINVHTNGDYAPNKVIFHKLAFDNTSQIADTAYTVMVHNADTSAIKTQNAQIAYSLMTGDK